MPDSEFNRTFIIYIILSSSRIVIKRWLDWLDFWLEVESVRTYSDIEFQMFYQDFYETFA